MSNTKFFTVQQNFNHYLQLSNLTRLDPTSVHYQELKKAYFAAWGMMIVCLGDITKLSPVESTAIIAQQRAEIEKFYADEAVKFNLPHN